MIELKQIHGWMKNAGQIALNYFSKTSLSRDFKSDNTIVTEADLAVEKFLRGKIKAAFPEHTIIGEEFKNESGAGYAWIIDPIDGTAPFYWNIPTWCISIGLTENRQPYMGFVYVPLTGDFYYSMDGVSFLDGKPIKALSGEEISDDSAFCISTRAFNKYDLIGYEGMVFALGSGIFNNMMVARGSVIGALSMKPSVWDLAAAARIIETAGAKMVYLTGEPLDLSVLHESKVATHPVLAAPSQLIEPLLEIIKLYA